MKFLFILAVTFLACASAGIYQPNVVVPPVESEGRITNGNTSAVGQFPYQVALRLHLGFWYPAWCGGSLIGSNWVLTAAHCTKDIQRITVYLGATKRISPEVNYTVSANDIIIHPDYTSEHLQNDISLIKIPSVTYSANIQPIRLPAIANSYSAYTGDYVIAAGWGSISDNLPFPANNLQWARFQVIPNTDCSGWYVENDVTDYNICVATPGGVSPCTGDSGGPLVLESTKEQIGILSSGGMDGCEKGYPAISIRLTSYLEWIKNNTGIAY